MTKSFTQFLMSSALGVTLAVGASVGASGTALAAAEQINCPHSQLRREVTTALPGGWWTTPYVNSLQNTRVIQISGRPALQCDYGPGGRIQRYAPDGANCTANAQGFLCQTPGVVAPVTYSTGLLDIPQTWTADLDHGNVGSGGEDIWFRAVNSSTFYIAPRNGASFSVSGSSNRGFSGCSSAGYSTAQISTRDIPLGTYICVRTNEGRISEFRLNEYTHDGNVWHMHIGYTTWQ